MTWVIFFFYGCDELVCHSSSCHEAGFWIRQYYCCEKFEVSTYSEVENYTSYQMDLDCTLPVNPCAGECPEFINASYHAP